VAAISRSLAVSYSRPVDPRTAEEGEAEESKNKLVRTLQYHQCSLTMIRVVLVHT